MNGKPAAPTLCVHADFIKGQLPDWLTCAPADLRNALRASLIKSNQARHDLKEFLQRLTSPEKFGRPLLRKALARTFSGQLHAENSFLLRQLKHHHLLGLVKTPAGTSEHTLLEAALQNFEEDEAEGDGIETGSGLYTHAPSGRVLSSVSPALLARLCRELDIGRHYQYHLEQVLGPTYTLSMTSRTRILFVEKERHGLAVSLHLALLNKTLALPLYKQLLTLAQRGAHTNLRCSHLSIGNVTLPGVLVIEPLTGQPHKVLYIPEDPLAPLRLHTSMQALNEELAERLSNTPGYLGFLTHFVPLEHRETLLAVRPAWRDWYSVGATGKRVPASLQKPLGCTPILGHVFLNVTRQRLEQIKQNARALAVPTEDADVASRKKRLQSYVELGKSLLFFAASFVPIVGEVLLLVSAAQLLGSVYNGFAAWSRGDSDEALNDLMDVVDNIALAAVTAGAVKTVGFTAGLVKVRMSHGGERLWKPDLAPYRHLQKTLPDGLPATPQGLYAHEGKTFLKLDDHLHTVKRDPLNQQWQLQPPNDPHAYTPPLLSNGVGGWRHAHETPRDWSDLKLIKRLGPDAANITEPQVQAILLVSGVGSSTLRQAHQEALRPPPQLRDTVQRFNLEQEIQQFDVYRAEGSHVTPHSPYLQLHLVGSLPEWPEGHLVNVVDEQGTSVISHGSGATVLKVPLARFRKGELLHCLEAQLPASTFNKLLPAKPADELTHVENLALRLTAQARLHPQRMFAWLTQALRKPGIGIEEAVNRLVPGLSQGHVEEMGAVFSPEQQRRLIQEKSLTAEQHWEADQYLQQARASRALESLHLDCVATAETPEMTLSTLERLPGWPAEHRIEVRDVTTTGPLLCSSGAEHATARYLVIRAGERYQPRDAQGQPLGEPTDLINAISQTLPTAPLNKVLKHAQAPTLKHAMRTISLQLMSKRSTARRAPLLRGASFPSRRLIDPSFAEPTLPEGALLRTDGVYQAPALADGSVRHYVLDNAKYYRVRPDSHGLRLMDARSHYRAYQPYLRKRIGGGWELDDALSTALGEMPAPASPSPSNSADDEFVSAESASDYESADEGTLVYSPSELSHMRSEKSYQDNQNYLRVFDRANNGRYPLRDVDGQPMRIRFIQAVGTSPRSASTFKRALVMPFIQWEGFEKVAALYDEKLRVIRFTSAHQKCPEESALIGQSMVVAARAIRKGEALGVYGGELLPLHVAEYRGDPYLLDVFTHRWPDTRQGGAVNSRHISTDIALSGDNTLSRINTLFEYEHGTPVRQASTGYNVEDSGYAVDTQVGDQPMVRLRLTAFFASEDIPAGAELRWNYGYDEAAIASLFAPPRTEG